MALPDKIVNSVARHVNRKGRWHVSRFNYDSWMELSDRISNSNLEEAYIIKALTYYTNGELDHFLEYATKLFDTYKNFDTFNIYITAVHTNGQLEHTINIFDEYVDHVSADEDYHLLFRNHITHARYALNNSTLEENYEKYQKVLDKEIRSLMFDTIKLNDRDLKTLRFAGIDKELFLEVMGVAVQTLSEFGNFVTDYGLHIKKPNDDLTLSIHGEKIDIELMHELNEAWLDKIVDHESEYPFDQLSRVLVNFQPGNYDSKEEYVS